MDGICKYVYSQKSEQTFRILQSKRCKMLYFGGLMLL